MSRITRIAYITPFICICNLLNYATLTWSVQVQQLLFPLKETSLPPLPRLLIYSDFPFRQINNSFWKILTNLEHTEDTGEEDDDEVFEMRVESTYPLFVFYKQFLSTRITMPSFINWRNADNIFDKSSFRFGVDTTVYRSYAESQSQVIEFRSNIAPFPGISVSFKYNSQDGFLSIFSNPQVSVETKNYFHSTQWQDKEESSVCDGEFLILQTGEDTFPISGEWYGCRFSDGSEGKNRLFSSYQMNTLDIQLGLYTAKKSCWKWCRDSSFCKPLYPHQLQEIDSQFQWRTKMPRCDPLSNDRGGHETFYSTPVIFGLPKEASATPEIYFQYRDIRPESMIDMTDFEIFQNFNATLVINCTISPYYASQPFKLAVQNHGGAYEALEFISDPPFETGGNPFSTYESYIIQLNSTSWTRVFCIAPVVGSYDWINASRPIHILKPMSPKFLHNKNIACVPHSKDRNKFIAQINLKFGLEDTSIICNVTGHPLPEITWTHNNVNFNESDGNVKPHQFRWSQINLFKLDVVHEKKYICTAQNSEGVASVTFELLLVSDDKDKLDFSSFSIIPSISIIGPILVLAAGAGIVSWRIKYRKQRRSRDLSLFLTNQEYNDFMNGNVRLNLIESDTQVCCPISSKPFPPKFILPRDALIFDTKEVLGSGNSGIVLKGSFCRETTTDVTETCVAIKTLKPNVDYYKTMMNLKGLLYEIKVHAHLESHPNIVGFYGACIDNIRKGEVYATVEFCQNGDLLTFLRKQKALCTQSVSFSNASLTRSGSSACVKIMEPQLQDKLIMWSSQIASGMSFLRLNNVIHGDLAARNVLITADNVAKLSDFGLARQLLNDYSVYVKKSKVALPWKWLALESLTSSTFSVKSDVWSFGVTLWEIFTLGDAPYSGLRYNANFIQQISSGYRLSRPSLANIEIYGIMQRCWGKDPDCRPIISSIFNEIQKMIQKV